MKIIETVETVIDLDLLDKVLQEHSFPKEYNHPRFKRWMKRLKKEGTLFVRKRYKMPLKEYQSVYFHRFENFLALATVRVNLTCKTETV